MPHTYVLKEEVTCCMNSLELHDHCVEKVQTCILVLQLNISCLCTFGSVYSAHAEHSFVVVHEMLFLTFHCS